MKRARQRYPKERDNDGFYVRGRRENDGTWTPVPCPCAKCSQALAPAARFATVDEGVQHELAALQTGPADGGVLFIPMVKIAFTAWTRRGGMPSFEKKTCQFLSLPSPPPLAFAPW